MTRWFNPSHPQTLQAAVILGYISAVFGALAFAGFNPLLLLLCIGIGAGAFGSANNQRWGYFLLAGCSLLLALFWWLLLVGAISGGSVVGSLQRLNAVVFPTALAVAAWHNHSREYQKVWFE
ncbi:MAG: hypothetical protein AAF467_15445 [Actinomycetota bacterium]